MKNNTLNSIENNNFNFLKKIKIKNALSSFVDNKDIFKKKSHVFLTELKTETIPLESDIGEFISHLILNDSFVEKNKVSYNNFVLFFKKFSSKELLTTITNKKDFYELGDYINDSVCATPDVFTNKHIDIKTFNNLAYNYNYNPPLDLETDDNKNSFNNLGYDSNPNKTLDLEIDDDKLNDKNYLKTLLSTKPIVIHTTNEILKIKTNEFEFPNLIHFVENPSEYEGSKKIIMTEILKSTFISLSMCFRSPHLLKKFLGEEKVQQQLEAKANMVENSIELKKELVEIKSLKEELLDLKEQLTEELVNRTKSNSNEGVLSKLAKEDKEELIKEEKSIEIEKEEVVKKVGSKKKSSISNDEEKSVIFDYGFGEESNRNQNIMDNDMRRFEQLKMAATDEDKSFLNLMGALELHALSNHKPETSDNEVTLTGDSTYE